MTFIYFHLQTNKIILEFYLLATTATVPELNLCSCMFIIFIHGVPLIVLLLFPWLLCHGVPSPRVVCTLCVTETWVSEWVSEWVKVPPSPSVSLCVLIDPFQLVGETTIKAFGARLRCLTCWHIHVCEFTQNQFLFLIIWKTKVSQIHLKCLHCGVWYMDFIQASLFGTSSHLS